MIAVVTAAIGAVLGALAARRRGGKPADIAQYAAVWAMIGALLGFFLSIALARLV